MSPKANLKAWMDAGMPDDAESLARYRINTKDVLRLEKRLMAAIAEKRAMSNKMVFSDHRTMQ